VCFGAQLLFCYDDTYRAKAAAQQKGRFSV
jgi:hypothetical protein